MKKKGSLWKFVMILTRMLRFSPLYRRYYNRKIQSNEDYLERNRLFELRKMWKEWQECKGKFFFREIYCFIMCFEQSKSGIVRGESLIYTGYKIWAKRNILANRYLNQTEFLLCLIFSENWGCRPRKSGLDKLPIINVF